MFPSKCKTAKKFCELLACLCYPVPSKFFFLFPNLCQFVRNQNLHLNFDDDSIFFGIPHTPIVGVRTYIYAKVASLTHLLLRGRGRQAPLRTYTYIARIARSEEKHPHGSGGGARQQQQRLSPVRPKVMPLVFQEAHRVIQLFFENSYSRNCLSHFCGKRAVQNYFFGPLARLTASSCKRDSSIKNNFGVSSFLPFSSSPYPALFCEQRQRRRKKGEGKG